MSPLKRLAAWLTFAVTAALASPAGADPNVLRIGVMADFSGLYSDLTGKGAQAAVELAVQDFGKLSNGKRIEVVTADHQNKADIAGAIARRWFDNDGVDVAVNFSGTATALAAVDAAKRSNKVALVTGALSSRLSNESCTPNHVHYSIDTYALARGATSAMIDQGKKKWFFITVDYAFGHAFQADAEKFIKEAGGTVVGSVRHPLNTNDFASFILQAQSSGADVVALANAGSDLQRTISQAVEFGLTGKQSLTALVLFLPDLHAIGLEKARGTTMVSPFYWDRTDATREFSKRYFDKVGRMPGDYHGGDYSAVLHYLRTVDRVGWADGAKVVAAMKNVPINDFYAEGGQIRDDGLLVKPVFLLRVKAPAQSRYPWDYAEVLSTVPGDKAFQPLAASRCPLVRKQ
jgi:branched-chain amino acid transport system substrate-binding protein